MATIDTEKYTRINLMVVKGGTKLTRRLFLQRIKDLSPAGQEYTVDEFLNNNKNKILKKATGKNKTETIYPSSGNTNLDKWDLYLFCFVLEETCELKVINKKDIEKLHKMRNKLCHLNEPTLTTDEFEERLEKLKIIFNRTLKLINDTDFETTLNADISNFETGPLSLACIEKFHHEVGLQRLEIIENQTKMLDNQTKMFGYHDKHSNKLDDALSRLDDISHRLPVNLDVKVPALRLIIDIQNCSGDIEESLLNFMMKLFNENITKPDCNVLEEFPNIAMHKISEAVSNTFRAFLNNDAFVVKVERKCLLLTIECKTIQSFVNFVRDYISGTLLKKLENLQIAIRNWEGCENVVLFPQISQEEIIDAIYEMVINLDQKVPKRGQASIEDRQSTQMTSDGNGLLQSPEIASSYHQRNCVRISITPRKDYGRNELDTVLKSGDIQSGVQKIQTEMREESRFSDVKISVQLSCSDWNRTELTTSTDIKEINDEETSLGLAEVKTSLFEECETLTAEETDILSSDTVSGDKQVTTLKTEISQLLTTANDKLYSDDEESLYDDIVQAVNLLNKEKESILIGKTSEITEKQLAEWYERCYYILSQTNYDHVLAAICYYTGTLFDLKWRPGRRHSDVVDYLLGNICQEIFWSIVHPEDVLDSLDELAIDAYKKGNVRLCIAIDKDIDKIYRFCNVYTLFYRYEKSETPQWKEAILRSARCYLDLECHGDAKKACINVLRDFSDYDDVQALEIWSQSLYKTEEYGLALDKCLLAMKYCKNKEEEHRLQTLKETIETKTRTETKEEIEPDVDWLRGTNVVLETTTKKKNQTPKRAKNRHRRPKTRERHREEDKSTFEIEKTENEIIYERVKKHRNVPDENKHKRSVHLSGESSTEIDVISLSDQEDTDDEICNDIPSLKQNNPDSSCSGSDIEENDADEEIQNDNNITFFDQSRMLYNENNLQQKLSLTEEELFKNGIKLNHEYLAQLEEKRTVKSKRIAFYSELLDSEMLKQKLIENPKKYIKCIVYLESSHEALCTPVECSINVSVIEISGRTKIGMVFNEDQVVVELLDNKEKSDRRYGKIIGILDRQRHKNVTHPVFLCTLDQYESSLVWPICKTVPKIHVLDKEITHKYKTSEQKMNKIEIYEYSAEHADLRNPHIQKIHPSARDSYLFFVAYIHWGKEYPYPRGAIIKKIKCGNGIAAGLKILNLQYKIPRLYSEEATREVEQIIENESHNLQESFQDREDLTHKRIFIMAKEETGALEKAFGLEVIENGFKVGVHVIDVAHYVKEDSAIDKEAFNRGVTVSPDKLQTRYMFPEPLSTHFFSLLPNQRRATISVFMYLSENGGPLQMERNFELKKTYIKPEQLITFDEVTKIMTETGESKFDKETTRLLKHFFKIAMAIRRRRNLCGTAILKEDGKQSQPRLLRSMSAEQVGCLIEDILLMANRRVSGQLLRTYENHVPLIYQPPTTEHNLEHFWKKFESFIRIVTKIQHDQIVTKRPDLSVQLRPKTSSKDVIIFKCIWQKMLSSPQTAIAYLQNDTLHPMQSVVYQHWISIQEKSLFLRSNSRPKLKEKRDCTLTSLTSPLQRYSDLVTQRLVHAALKRKKCHLHEQYIDDLCTHLNSMTLRTRHFELECENLQMLCKLHDKPFVFTCIIDEISDKGLSFIVPELVANQSACATLGFNLLDLAYKPEITSNDSSCTVDQRVKVVWRKRIYDFKIQTKDITSFGNEIPLNPYKNVVFVSLKEWTKMLKCVSEGGNLDKVLKTIKVSEYHKGVDDVSTEFFDALNIQQHTTFSLTLTSGQPVQMQLTAVESNGKLTLKPMLFSVTQNVQLCLQHTEDPVMHLYRFAEQSTCEKYDNIDHYLNVWMPIMLMESATVAVGNEESFTINNVPIIFNNNKSGKFVLGLAECEIRNIELSGTEEDDEQAESMHCYDWLCLRKVLSNENTLSKPSVNFESFETVWVGHAAITKVKKSTKKRGRLEVSFSLSERTPDLTENLHNIPVKVNIEVLRKPEVHRRTESFLKMLRKDPESLAAKIALNDNIPKLDKKYMSIATLIERDLYIEETADDKHFKPLPRNNSQQQKAIDKALMSRFSLIQGPPGTGKTYTGIKLIYLFNVINEALYKEGSPRKQVLFCGPSNKSVDLVAKWMLQRMGKKQPNFVRVYGRSIETLEFPVPGRTFYSLKTARNQGTPTALRPVALHHLIRQKGKKYAEQIIKLDQTFERNGYKPMPMEVKEYVHLVREASIDEIRRHDVILCTTAVGTNPKVLEASSVQQVIIDEAGMCPEPQCLVPIIATKAQQVVLIGDHKQLRPVIKCKEAAQLGLETSLFERYALLFKENAQIKPSTNDPFTMLNEQYRMHPEICKFPSQMFYDDKLETRRGYWYGWRLDIWPKDENNYYPHVFVHVEGEEKALTVTTEEGNEQSKSNTAEIDHLVKVYAYLNGMKQPRDKIHILSQYNAQCTEIKKRLKELDETFDEESVSTVVSSQGGEWDYVIISTVRSLPHYKIEKNPIFGWCIRNLGFIIDRNQVNVALTRAQKGLVIIGNKNLLACDELWKELIDYYEMRGCVKTQSEFPPDHHKFSDIIEKGPTKKQHLVRKSRKATKVAKF